MSDTFYKIHREDNITNLLRIDMALKELTQTSLAETLGISPSTISMVLSGQRKACQEILDYLGLEKVYARTSENLGEDNLALTMIVNKRDRQDVLGTCGVYTDHNWGLVIMEYLGEVTRLILNHCLEVEDLVKIAAVLLAWIERLLEKNQEKESGNKS